MIRYAQQADGGIGEKAAASVLVWSLVGFMLGRFAGTALMLRYNAGRLMAAFAGINILLCLVAVVLGGMPGLLALAATSFFMSIMFPTIFAMALKNLGPLTPSGSSLLVMSIIGGAILPALMGGVSDLSSIRVAMLLPAGCFAIVGAFALARGSRAADMRLAQAAC